MSRITNITFAPTHSTYLLARALECAMQPFGSLSSIDAHDLTSQIVGWTHGNAHAAVEILAIVTAANLDDRWAPARVEFGAGGVGLGSIALVTPTSHTRIEVARSGIMYVVSVDFGTAGSTQRATAILAAADLLRQQAAALACDDDGQAIDPSQPVGAHLAWTVAHAPERGTIVEFDRRALACLREVLQYADQRACNAAGRPLPHAPDLGPEAAFGTLDDIDTIRAAVGWPTGREHEASLDICRRTGRRAEGTCSGSCEACERVRMAATSAVTPP